MRHAMDHELRIEHLINMTLHPHVHCLSRAMMRSEIARNIPCSANTVLRWVSQWQEEHSLKEKERSGRPRITDQETDDRIVAPAEEKKFITPKQIQ
jgi:transposase